MTVQPLAKRKGVFCEEESEWIGDVTKPLLIYTDGRKVGEANMVRYHDNAHAKRRFKGNRRKDIPLETFVPEAGEEALLNPSKNAIS